MICKIIPYMVTLIYDLSIFISLKHHGWHLQYDLPITVLRAPLTSSGALWWRIARSHSDLRQRVTRGRMERGEWSRKTRLEVDMEILLWYNIYRERERDTVHYTNVNGIWYNMIGYDILVWYIGKVAPELGVEPWNKLGKWGTSRLVSVQDRNRLPRAPTPKVHHGFRRCDESHQSTHL